MSPIACPSPERLFAFAVGELPETELAEVAEHLDRCGRCGEQAGQFDRATDPILAGLRLIGDAGLNTLVAAEATDGWVAAGDVPALAGTWAEFRIVREIGRGGMGVVYEAYQESLNRHVAVKLLREPADLARFRREARAAGRLHHTNIVPVHGVGEHDGRHYYVMQYIVGRGLDEVLRARRPGAGRGPAVAAVDPREAARIALQAAEALAYAHDQGVVHRDIKPSNILLDERGTVWITDFGLAFDSSDTQTLTRTGDLLGTLRYLAPERFAGRGDAGADIYALGATLYELACGRPAFPEADRAVLIRRVLHEDPPRPRQVDPRVPLDLETIVLKAMAREPSRRYADAAELAGDLRRFIEDRPIRARRVGARDRLVRWCRRNPAMAGLVGGIALAMVVGTAAASYYAIRAGRGEALASRNLALALENADRADREARRAREEALVSDHRLYTAQMRLATQAWQEGQTDLAEQYLLAYESPPADRPDWRAFEWHYLRRLCQPERLILRGHAHNVMGVAFAPDGRTLATASEDHTARVWDAATGRELRAFRGHTSNVIDLAISPDGRRIASGGMDRVVRIWDAATAREMMALPGHSRWILGVAFAPDGRTLATAGMDGTIKVWDADAGRELRTLRGHENGAWDVAFSPDGRRIASVGADATARLWDAATGRELHALRGHIGQVWGVAYSPDGRTLASAGADATVRLWDVATGRDAVTLRGHSGQVINVAFSPDGRTLASTSDDRGVKLWDVATGRSLLTQRRHEALAWGVAFSPDGRTLASASNDRTVRLWDTGLEPGLTTLRGHVDAVQAVAFDPGGRALASAGVDRAVKLWDTGAGRDVLTLRGHTAEVRCLAYQPGGRLLASGAGSPDRTVRLWDVDTGRARRVLRGHQAGVRGLAFHPDGRLLASASTDSTVRLWDVDTGRVVRALSGHRGYVHAVAFSGDGVRVASAGDDTTVRVWDAATGAEIATLKGHSQPVRGVAFGPDGRTLASAGQDRTVRLWDVTSGRERAILRGHAAGIHAVAFSPDGRRIASAGGDMTIRLWDVATSQEVFELRGHTDLVAAVAFRPDGLALASAGVDRTLRLWDATPMTPELRAQRAARDLVEDLFGQSLSLPEVRDRIRTAAAPSPEARRRALDLAGPYGESRVAHEAERRVESLYHKAMVRADVLASLRADASLSEPIRRAALALAEQIPEDPGRLRTASWLVVRRPGADPGAYRLALRQAEAACRLVPDNPDFLAILGAAQYRVGRFGDAVATLSRAGRLDANSRDIPGAADLALLALSQQALGRPEEARASLRRLRDLLKTPNSAQGQEAGAILGEARALELDLTFPTDPFAP